MMFRRMRATWRARWRRNRRSWRRYLPAGRSWGSWTSTVILPRRVGGKIAHLLSIARRWSARSSKHRRSRNGSGSGAHLGMRAVTKQSGTGNGNVETRGGGNHLARRKDPGMPAHAAPDDADEVGVSGGKDRGRRAAA